MHKKNTQTYINLKINICNDEKNQYMFRFYIQDLWLVF